MSVWKKTIEELPPTGKYVIGRCNRTNWHDSEDQENCTVVVVKICQGISMRERAALSDGDLRKRMYRFCDEHGNNLKPYAFSTFGPGSFNGQEIEEWCEIPKEKDTWDDYESTFDDTDN